MKSYIVTTGMIFGLLTVAHVWRMVEETHLATDPFFVFVTLLSATLCLWAWRVLKLLKLTR